jgi:spore maturation protein CgeB
MSVYVGIDVHRKRSQVAVVTEDGKVQLKIISWFGEDKAGAAILAAAARGPAARGVDRPAAGAPAG